MLKDNHHVKRQPPLHLKRQPSLHGFKSQQSLELAVNDLDINVHIHGLSCI